MKHLCYIICDHKTFPNETKSLSLFYLSFLTFVAKSNYHLFALDSPFSATSDM